MKIMGQRSQTEEASKTQALNDRLRREVDSLKKEVASLKQIVGNRTEEEKKRTLPTKPEAVVPAPPPQ